MDTRSEFLKNVWYAAGWSEELAQPPQGLSRLIAGVRVFLFRTPEGVAAVLDRCPHRFAPLSKGRLHNGMVECGYHGLRFDGTGQCVGNPHGPVPRGLAIPAFLVNERHGVLWLWMGDPHRAEVNLIPDLSPVPFEPVTAVVRGHLEVNANHQLLVDNILDLSHADYLHRSSLDGGGMMTRTRPRVEERGNTILAEWSASGEKAIPIFRAELPDPEMKVDMWTEVVWYPGGAMVLKTGVTPTGSEREQGICSHAAHMMTPATGDRTHYFYAVWRNYRLDDAPYNDLMRDALRHAFQQEDQAMIEAQQQRIGRHDIMDLNPTLLTVDLAPTRARRVFHRLLSTEAQQLAAQA